MTYSTESDYLYVSPGTSSVKILSYFSGSEMVKCEYRMVRQYTTYDSDGKPHTWEDWKTGTAYYYIICNGNDPGPGPNPDPDPDPGTLTAYTVEGIKMVFSLNDDGSAYTGVGYGGTAVATSTVGTITIPDQVQGHTVGSIGAFSFYQCSRLSKVIIPSSIKSINQSAFAESGIENLVFPNSITYINSYAFKDCNNLKVLELPSSLTTLYSNAINSCPNLTEVTLPSSLKTIGQLVIWNCPALKKITCLRSTPLSLSNDPFGFSIYDQATLYVPKGSVNLYREANYWNQFDRIREIGDEGNDPKLMLSASPSGGEVSKGTTAFLTAKADGTTVSGCDIYYTTNGTTPSRNNGTKYSSGITINNDCTLKAIAYKSGYEDSDVLAATYTIKENQKPKLVLTASPSGGQVSAGTTVTLTVKADGSTVYGCDIYYTTNGSTPSKSNGTKYSSGITINSACTLKAIAYKSGYEDSNVLTETYTMIPTPTPRLVLSASPSGGKVEAWTKVTLTTKANGSTVTGCDIYYTTDGSTPTKNSSKYTSSGINIYGAIILKAIAYKTGYETSEVLTTTYATELYLKATPSGGSVEKGTKVQITSRDADGNDLPADIYYTLNGSTPTKNSTKYTPSGVAINANCTLKAVAYNYDITSSSVLTATYTVITEPVKMVSVATGMYHSLFLQADGSMWTCGGNDQGQLGDGTMTDKHSPLKVMDGVASIAAGEQSSFIVKKDGSLWACGCNGGAYGNGTTTRSLTYVKIMDDVANVSSSVDHTLIVKIDGSLWSCGKNDDGQLGDGTTTTRLTPVKIMDGVKSASAGKYNHSLIVKNDGSLWACGNNTFGQLGDGTTTRRLTPVKIMDEVSMVSAGADYSLFLKSDGSLWGCGTTTPWELSWSGKTSSPVKILDGVQAVSAGEEHILAIKNDNSLWTCGLNREGELGDGTTDAKTFGKVATSVACVSGGGGEGLFAYSLFVKTDGSVWACGGNEYGQLGDGTTTDRYSPVQITFVNSEPRSKLTISASPSGGQVSYGTKVTLTAKADGSTVSGCDIYYTLNGTTPTKSSTKYTSSGITINSDCTLKAIAYKSGYEDSDMLTVTYTVKKKLELSASPSGGEVLKGNTVILTVMANGSSVSGSDIYYTLNGTMPTKSSTKYMSSGITINGNCTLKAIAYKDGYETSDVLTVTYTVKKKLELSASPSGGEVEKGTIVTLTVKNDGNTVSDCDIYYSLNGAIPTKSSTKYEASGITMNNDCTLKAIAYKEGYEDSDVLTANYTAVYVPVTLSIMTSSAGYATFFDSQSAYTLTNGLSAQVVTGASNAKLTYKTIADGSVSGVVPKGTAVMLVSDTKQAGTYTLTSSESTATYTGTNLLRGSDEATMTTGDGYHYKLSYGHSGTGWSDVFGWYWGENDGAPFQIEGHKAWMVVPKTNGTRAMGYSIDGDALYLDDNNHEQITNNRYYDLQGRLVSQPMKKGVYIKDGKKVVK